MLTPMTAYGFAQRQRGTDMQFGLSLPGLFGQLTIGLSNGAFYAVLSLGVAIIFGMLNIINFAHGALYMLGAMCAWLLLSKFAINYWVALFLVPVLVGLFGMLLERLLIRRVYSLEHMYGFLLTFGLALIIEGVFRERYGVAGLTYPVPDLLDDATDLGFMYLPNYRGWVIAASLVVCFSTWLIIERTMLGAYLRASTENPILVRAFGINVSRLTNLTYGLGAGLAALAGVLAAPLYQVSPLMGSNLIITVFAIVVIGGVGSILGTVLTGYGMGLIEGLTKVFVPEASTTVIFIIMAIVLIARPSGLFGRTS
jgi:branched-chain amino acid transport system permease protein